MTLEEESGRHRSSFQPKVMEIHETVISEVLAGVAGRTEHYYNCKHMDKAQ